RNGCDQSSRLCDGSSCGERGEDGHRQRKPNAAYVRAALAPPSGAFLIEWCLCERPHVTILTHKVLSPRPGANCHARASLVKHKIRGTMLAGRPLAPTRVDPTRRTPRAGITLHILGGSRAVDWRTGSRRSASASEERPAPWTHREANFVRQFRRQKTGSKLRLTLE